MIDRKCYWLTILALLAAKCHCDKLNKLYLPPPKAGTSGGSLFLETPDLGTIDSRVNEIAAYNEQGDPGNVVKPHELNIFQEPDLEFGPQGSPTKFVHSGELPTGSFGYQPTDAFNALFLKSTVPERPERHQALFDRTSQTVVHHNHNDGDTFMYNLETDNGISADLRGSASNGVESEGGFAYTGDDGKYYSVRYAAGKNGFVPRGSHLPTPPPIPVEIQRALEKNAKDEANGIYDDGSYDPHKYPGNYHYDPAPGTSPNDAVDSVNNHNHIYSQINEDPGASNHVNPVYTESSVDMHLLQGNNNVENLNALVDDTVVTDAANPNSFPGFRSLEAAARIGGFGGSTPSRIRYKGAQYLPPVPIHAQHLDIGAPTILGNANRRVLLPNRQPQRYDPKKPHKPIAVPRNRKHGY